MDIQDLDANHIPMAHKGGPVMQQDFLGFPLASQQQEIHDTDQDYR